MTLVFLLSQSYSSQGRGSGGGGSGGGGGGGGGAGDEDYEIPPITPPNHADPSLLHLMEHEAGYPFHSLPHNGLLNTYSYPELPALRMSNMLGQDSHLLTGPVHSVSTLSGSACWLLWFTDHLQKKGFCPVRHWWKWWCCRSRVNSNWRTFSSAMFWKGEKVKGRADFEYVTVMKGGLPGSFSVFFQSILGAHTPNAPEKALSWVKTASDRTCKHPRRTHSDALIIVSNQMNYRWPVRWIIQRYILSSDINITFLSASHEYLHSNVSIPAIYTPLIRTCAIFRIKLHKLQAPYFRSFLFFLWMVAQASSSASLQD